MGIKLNEESLIRISGNCDDRGFRRAATHYELRCGGKRNHLNNAGEEEAISNC
jgi:hypothetical protein